ncbi:hypothetical protein MIDIC_140024 [Alphaproteobacteria bacterium]
MSELGALVQGLERTAHNGVVAGSNPAGPTMLVSGIELTLR